VFIFSIYQALFLSGNFHCVQVNVPMPILLHVVFCLNLLSSEECHVCAVSVLFSLSIMLLLGEKFVGETPPTPPSPLPASPPLSPPPDPPQVTTDLADVVRPAPKEQPCKSMLIAWTSSPF